MSIEAFGKRVIDLILFKEILPGFRKSLEDSGVRGHDLNAPELVIFLLFPFSLMVLYSFGDESQTMRQSLIEETARKLKRRYPRTRDSAEQLILDRLREYAAISVASDEGGTSIAESGLRRLAGKAAANVVGHSEVTADLQGAFMSRFRETYESFEGGRELWSLYRDYLLKGDREWMFGVKRGRKS
jgi:hypothetical protein